MSLTQFRSDITVSDPLAFFRAGLIGEGMMIPGSKGDVPLIYADYVASGRALKQVEEFVASQVLPYYANTHTQASFCGGYMTRLREDARAEIARLVGADDDCSVIFTGAGATAGLNRLVALLGVNEAVKPVVFIGPYEHHSNILPWRESKAEVIEIPEAKGGGIDLEALETALEDHRDCDVKIGAFSAASNVTGVLSNQDETTRLLKTHGALAVWDFAGGGPYIPIDMGRGDTAKDAVVTSPHKFPGGPGATGVMIVRNSATQREKPCLPGGGTVSFVSPWGHTYSDNLSVREESGTPNVIGDIRAALAFMVKDAIGEERIAAREAAFAERAMAAFQAHPQIQVLGHDTAHRLPIFSLMITDVNGAPVHQQLFTRMLSDLTGIQTRGGCACAGPYAHRLLDLSREESDELFADLQAGAELRKPGWVRLNFSYLMTDETVDHIISSVLNLAETAHIEAENYTACPKTARFAPRQTAA
ncbi:aminotransferase class V-fold PLP-dependent enzyme [Halocynthiibacter sp. C4]|uniref:aminotransferase class V-fold PLP-dependent enzyme n=1 Tax=Halocynthiibacter sp. C4 TaxID=2992758 RepID=UPI00237B1C03|nr:aminotransferase class V-fold PLP-dependent enzyme [Halocynthiibacter sp. C4]MDE0590309.1 aminotransferase class V-fold PLP-dependent enzyme [Halocynthiibacter sp. C4]